jgi:hypothetical protein
MSTWDDLLPILIQSRLDVKRPQDTRDINEQRVEGQVDPRAGSAAESERQVEVLEMGICGLEEAFRSELFWLREHICRRKNMSR